MLPTRTTTALAMPTNSDVSAEVVAELRALEERLLDPAVRAVPAQVRALLAPEFVEFGASGRVFNRDAILAMLAAEPPRVARLARSFKVRMLAPGAALTTWRVLRDDGIETLRSSVWQHQDGCWQMVFHQGTQAATDDEATS
jgi:hypothetical protein